MHNDLHGLNILIQNYGEKTVTDTYEIEDIPPFSMSIQYRVKVFDFDHASCDFLGENPLWLTDGFEPNKDLACLYRWILSVGQPMIKRTHIDELFDTSKIVADYKKATADVKKIRIGAMRKGRKSLGPYSMRCGKSHSTSTTKLPSIQVVSHSSSTEMCSCKAAKFTKTTDRKRDSEKTKNILKEPPNRASTS